MKRDIKIAFSTTAKVKEVLDVEAKERDVSVPVLCRGLIELMTDVPQRDIKGYYETYEKLVTQEVELQAKIKHITKEVESSMGNLKKAVQVAEEAKELYEHAKDSYVTSKTGKMVADMLFNADNRGTQKNASV